MPSRLRLAAPPLALLLLLAGLAGCGGGDSASQTTAVSCDYPSDGQAAKAVDPPGDDDVASGEVPVTLTTSVGTLQITLDGDATPCTVASFRSLARQGYYDDTSCHRLTTAGIFVLQCGDPTGTGRGGPGYRFDDELSGDETYPAGTVAMANAGADTNGSQFFLVYRDTQLKPDYAVFGHLDDASVKILQQVASQGTADGSQDGAPKVPVEITSVA